MEFLRKLIFDQKPTQIIVQGFLGVILAGALLLMLPVSSRDGYNVGFIDALFTSTSAVCVTGLVVVNTAEHWSVFGKIVILFLIQTGGLGFMTFITSILLFFGRKITLSERILVQESFNLSNFQGIVVFVKKIVYGTFIIESIGALLLCISFIPKYGFAEGVAYSIFHSISAFCNAGFDIIGRNSFVDYSYDYILNIAVILLIIIGGLGFSVWMDLLKFIRSMKNDKLNFWNALKKLTLHTKLALTTTAVLIIFGWIFFFVSEFTNQQTMGADRFDIKILSSLFQSVTLRTAGFDTINQAGMTDASKFVSVILMTIGGSPGGTAGGIKTVTAGLVLISVASVIRGSDSITAFKKSVSVYNLQKALAVMTMMLLAIFVSTILVSMLEADSLYKHEFIDVLFETVSALGTVGLSTGITPWLSTASKIIIIICMFMGRLGPITVAIALAARRGKNQNLIHYPEEKILVG